MRVALIQMPVVPDKQRNIQTALAKIREAADNGADFAVLPEMFCCPYDNSCFRPYGEPEGGEAQAALSALAAERKLYLVGGTVPELAGDQVYNTCYVYGPDGRQLARHRKAHLFDIDVPGGQRFRESDTFPGETPSPPLRRPSAPWACASALTCGSRSWPGACACGAPR